MQSKSTVELLEARTKISNHRAELRVSLQQHEANLKKKVAARDKILDRLRILEKTLRAELRDTVVSFTKVAQVKEAIDSTKALLDGIQPPLDKLELDIADLKNGIEDADEHVKALDKEVKKRGKVIRLDRK